LRREELYLADIVEAADAVAGFVSGVAQKEFTANDLLQSAVLQKLTIIGEAAARLSQAFRERHPEVEWRDVIAFRNIAVHSYFSMQWSIVWVTATEDAPAIRNQISRILQAEYPGVLPDDG
jgi:uncharacterized protein with HEPN domain